MKRKKEKEEKEKEERGKEKKGKGREIKSKTSLLVLNNFPKDFTMPRTLPEALSIKSCILIGSICAP